MNGPITSPVPGRGRSLDRRTTSLPGAWLRLPDAPVLANTGPVWVRDATAEVTASDGPVLAMLSDAIPAISKTISSALKAGQRVYLLVPTKTALPKEWLAVTPTSLLVRHLASPPAGLLLAGARGWLWAGPVGPGEWRLALDAAQVEAARQAFLALFWQHATEETWPEPKGWQWRATEPPPFDLPVVGPDAPVCLEAERGAPRAGSVVCRPDGALPEGRVERLWVPPSTAGFDAVARLRAQGTQVGWSDLGLPPCTPAEVVAASAKWTLRVRTQAEQAKALAALLTGGSECEFSGLVTLRTLEERLGMRGGAWLAGQTGFAPLVPRRTLTLGTTPAASLRAVAETVPEKFPEPEPLALAVEWSWQVAVPGVPSGTSDDPLVKAWQGVDADHARRVDELRKRLKLLEEREGLLGRTWERLKGAVLGFGRSRGRLEQAIGALASDGPSSRGPAGARALLAKLVEAETDVGRLDADLGETERREREEDERRRQQKAWDEAQEKARRSLSEADVSRMQALEDLQRIEAELGTLGADTELDPKDRKVKQTRLRDDQQKAAARMRREEQAATQARKILNGSFEFRPAAVPGTGKGSTSFVPPPARAPAPVPDDALPRVGRLRARGKERYLAIRSWDELDTGEAEATRLKATLVADLEAT